MIISYKFPTVLEMRKTSRSLRLLMSKSSDSQWFEDEDSEDEENWNETPAERSARIAKKKAEKAKLAEASSELHKSNISMCNELVHELFVSEVCRIANFREAALKAKADALQFARAATLKRFHGAIVWNQRQNVSGGPLAIPWKINDMQISPKDTDSIHGPGSSGAGQSLPFSRSHHGGDWIEKVLQVLT